MRRLAPDAEVYSDGLGAFRAVIDLDHAHTVIQAGGGKAGTEADGARWVNVVMGNLKRSLDGTLHAFRYFKYAERYLGEAAWRFNRRFDLKSLVRSEEHTSELQSLMRISYAVFCLKKKTTNK